MDANEVDPEPPSIPRVATAADAEVRPEPVDAPRRSLLRSMGLGAKTGFRWTSYVVGPLAAAELFLVLIVTAFGVGSGRGWPFVPGGWVLTNVLRPLVVCFSCGLAGGIIGAVIELIEALIGRLLPPGSLRARWWVVANRPIRVSRSGGSTRTTFAVAPIRHPRRRWPRVVGVSALVLLAVAFGIGVFLGRWVDRRLAAASSVADRDDRFWRLADLMAHREPVPDAENSARVVAEALALLPARWPGGPAPRPGGPAPSRTPAEEGLDRLKATEDNIRLDDAVAEKLRTELDANEKAVRVARTLADHGRGRHELVLGPDLVDTFLPETHAARPAAQLLAADAAIRVHDGDSDGALDSCRAILGVGRSIGDEPFLGGQFVRMAIGRELAMKSTRRVLGQGQPSDVALAQLQTLILDELAQPILLHGLKGERAMVTELIRRFGAGEVPIPELSGHDVTSVQNGARLEVPPWVRLRYDNERAFALEWANEGIAIARRSAAMRPPLWAALGAKVDRVEQSCLGLYARSFPVLLMPVMAVADEADARYHAELGATVLLLAAERHRRRAGVWPASIAAIDPDILPGPPLDPYSGQAFRMARRNGQVLIYAIGPDRKDDHGAFDPRHQRNGGPDDIGAGAWDVPLRRQPAPAGEAPASADGGERR